MSTQSTRTFVPGFSSRKHLYDEVEMKEERYCIYCLQLAEEHEHSESHNNRYSSSYTYSCNCGSAQEEQKLQTQLEEAVELSNIVKRKIERLIETRDLDGIKTMNYEADLVVLKKKHNIQ